MNKRADSFSSPQNNIGQIISFSGGSRNFHKLGPTDCLRGGLFHSRFSDSLYKQNVFSQKGGLAPCPPKSASVIIKDVDEVEYMCY